MPVHLNSKKKMIAAAVGTLTVAGVAAALLPTRAPLPLSTETSWKDGSETDLATGNKYSYRTLENSPTQFHIILQDGGQWVKIIPATSSTIQAWDFRSNWGACPIQLRIEGEEAIGFGGMCPSDSSNSITLMQEMTGPFIASMQRGAGKKAYLSFQTYDGQVVEEVDLPKKYPM